MHKIKVAKTKMALGKFIWLVSKLKHYILFLTLRNKIWPEES